MTADTQLNVILLGAPGAGKGTQAERIVVRFGLPHISTGEMLRAAVLRGSEMGLAARGYMEAGALVPDEVVVGAVRERLGDDDARQGFLLDGFPRTMAQAERLDAMLAEEGRTVTRVVLIDVPAEELVGRIAGRRTCGGCGKLYSVTFDPPRAEGVCDVCGGELLQRADDSEATVRNRLAVYERQTAPLIGYYDERGLLARADGAGRGPDEVFALVDRILSGA